MSRRTRIIVAAAGLAASVAFCFSPWGQVQVIGPDGIVVNTSHASADIEADVRHYLVEARQRGPCNHARKGEVYNMTHDAGSYHEFTYASLYCDGEHWINGDTKR